MGRGERMKLKMTISNEHVSYRYATGKMTLRSALVFAARVIIGFALEGPASDNEILSDVEDATQVIRTMLVLEDENADA